MKLNAAQLRKSKIPGLAPRNGAGKNQRSKIKRNEIYIVLDNVLDTYNIGSIFRLADAVAAKKVYLCGGTETPPNPRIKKASINTTEWVEWEYASTAVEAISNIKDQISKIQIVAVEQREQALQVNKKSVPYDQFDYKRPICLVVGHETYGVSKEVLETADGIVEIPMFGVNISLNVMVSLGIVLYEVVKKCLI